MLISARCIYQAARFRLVKEESHHSFGQISSGNTGNWRCRRSAGETPLTATLQAIQRQNLEYNATPEMIPITARTCITVVAIKNASVESIRASAV